MSETGVQLPAIEEENENPLNHHQQESENTFALPDHSLPSTSGVKLSAIDEENPRQTRPYQDLLLGTRKEYIATAVPLYEASIRGDWKAANEILDERPELVRYSITENDETTLHVAASAKNTKHVEDFVKNLMDYMEETDLELKNNDSNTALCLAAAAGNVQIVKILVKKKRALVAISNKKEMTPLYMAVLFGHYEVAKYLYENSNLADGCWTPQNRSWLLDKCVEADMFDIAVQIVRDCQEPESFASVLRVLARKTEVFSETKSNIITRTINWLFAVIRPKVGVSEKETKVKALELLKIIWENIAERPRKKIDDILRGLPDDPINQYHKPAYDKEDQTLQLLEVINNNIVKMQKNKEPAATTSEGSNVVVKSNEKKTYSSRILFVAAEMGNTRFVIELIRLYPDLIWKRNDDGLSIFHTAVKHRHEGIYNILYEIGSMKDLITPYKDKNDNNMLHLVGKSARKKKLEDVSGVALQMQRELLWFKEVEKMIPPSYREKTNKDGLKPHELFTKEHKNLVKQGEEWMKGTATQCMLVATLIVTIVFNAAFTVPGGYNDHGIPFFNRRRAFIVFVLADAISLFSASASIIMFLSILTSRYAERDFLESLPLKLMLGLATLFLSITFMMIAFSVSFFVLYSNDLKRIPILISTFATVPVILFATLQFPLLKDVFGSTYGSRYLFRPKKHVLYENFMSNYHLFPFIIDMFSRCTSKITKLS